MTLLSVLRFGSLKKQVVTDLHMLSNTGLSHSVNINEGSV